MLGIVLAILLLLILTLLYLGGGTMTPVGAVPVAIQRLETTRSVVCDANRRQLQTEAILNPRLTGNDPEALRAAAAKLPPCPSGGRYYFLDGQVHCTAHSQRVTFAERFAKAN